MRIWTRFGTAVAILGAAWIGFQLGAARTAAASAEKDQAKTLLDMDRKFDEATFRNGVDAWISYCAEDGMLLPDGSAIVAGREAIRKYLGRDSRRPASRCVGCLSTPTSRETSATPTEFGSPPARAKTANPRSPTASTSPFGGSSTTASGVWRSISATPARRRRPRSRPGEPARPKRSPRATASASPGRIVGQHGTASHRGGGPRAPVRSGLRRRTPLVEVELREFRAAHHRG